MENEISYGDLKCREVVNSTDGRRLGRVTDIIFSCDTGRIKGIVLPFSKRGLFGKQQDLFVPWQCVKLLGSDVILVEINDLPYDDRSVERRVICKPKAPHRASAPPPPPPQCPPAPPENDKCAPCDTPESIRASSAGCDGKCEKCMLFECANRWEGI